MTRFTRLETPKGRETCLAGAFTIKTGETMKQFSSIRETLPHSLTYLLGGATGSTLMKFYQIRSKMAFEMANSKDRYRIVGGRRDPFFYKSLTEFLKSGEDVL